MYSEGQMRHIIRLGNRLHDEPGGTAGRRRELLRGLCELTGATAGFSALLTDDFLPVEAVAVTFPDTGDGVDPQRLGVNLLSPTSPLATPFVRRFARNGMEPTTLVRRDLVDDNTWYGSAYYRDRRRAMGYDDILISAMALPGQIPGMAAIGLNRPVGRTTGFDDRDAGLVNLVHAELRWTYDVKSTSTAEPHRQPLAKTCPMVNVPPRLQRVLHLLLAGHREKEIARLLALSPNTVHQYVKLIYSELKVSSRGELLARWVQSDPPPSPRAVSNENALPSFWRRRNFGVATSSA